MGGLEAELGEQRTDLGGREVGDLGAEGLQEGLTAVEESPGLVDLTDDHTGAERAAAGVQGDAAEERAEQGGLARAVGAGDGDPVGPVDLEVHRAEGEAAAADLGGPQGGDDGSGTGAAAISIRSSHSLRGSSTAPASSRSIMRWVCRALAACFSVDSARVLRLCLSLSVALRRALRTPLSIQLRCVRARDSRPARVSAYSSYSSRACRRATSRSSR